MIPATLSPNITPC